MDLRKFKKIFFISKGWQDLLPKHKEYLKFGVTSYDKKNRKDICKKTLDDDFVDGGNHQTKAQKTKSTDKKIDAKVQIMKDKKLLNQISTAVASKTQVRIILYK